MSARNEIVVVVGNPQAGSRTARIASEVGELLASVRQLEATTLIDLADQPESLLRWGDPQVASWKTRVLGAKALVVASPTYKASYTGLLKLFLDTFGHDELGGLLTVAVMTGGSAHHHLVVQHHLVPVLVEIGASCPTRGLYVFGPDIDNPTAAISAWAEAARPILARVGAA